MKPTQYYCLLFSLLVIPLMAQIHGRNTHYTLDLSAYFTITKTDTIKGHFAEHKNELSHFRFIKRYYFHYLDSIPLKNVPSSPERHITSTSRSILEGTYNAGQPAGKWIIWDKYYSITPAVCSITWTDYSITFTNDSISVELFDGSLFQFSRDFSEVKGIIKPRDMASLPFGCRQSNCHFITDNQTEVLYGHRDYLQEQLELLKEDFTYFKL